MTSNNNNIPHTYVAGEDEGRLAARAQKLGLERGRLPKKSWAALLWNDDTLTAARMHSIGFVAADERVDEYGTLHLMSLRKRKKRPLAPQYDQLTDLFTQPGDTGGGGVVERQAITLETTGEEGEDEEEEEVIDQVEGGSVRQCFLWRCFQYLIRHSWEQ